MRLRLPAPTNKKIGSGAALKVAAPGGSGSATLLCRPRFYFLFKILLMDTVRCGSELLIRFRTDLDPEQWAELKLDPVF